MKIGVVSDTHGLLRPEVAPALAGVERILHLGDVGKISILDELAKIAPVDRGARQYRPQRTVAASCRRPTWCLLPTDTFICCTI